MYWFFFFVSSQKNSFAKSLKFSWKHKNVWPKKGNFRVYLTQCFGQNTTWLAKFLKKSLFRITNYKLWQKSDFAKEELKFYVNYMYWLGFQWVKLAQLSSLQWFSRQLSNHRFMIAWPKKVDNCMDYKSNKIEGRHTTYI